MSSNAENKDMHVFRTIRIFPHFFLTDSLLRKARDNSNFPKNRADQCQLPYMSYVMSEYKSLNVLSYVINGKFCQF